MDSPADIETLTAALMAERDRAVRVEAELALARAKIADDAAIIARQNLEIAKLKRQIYGPRSERTARLLDQMELELEDLEADATEDEIAAERAVAKTTNVAPFTRKRPSRQPFPAHLPRERVVIPASAATYGATIRMGTASIKVRTAAVGWNDDCRGPFAWQALIDVERQSTLEVERQSAAFSSSFGVECAGGRPRPRLRSRAALRR